MTLDDLKELILLTSHSEFCRDYLFDDSMWYFDSQNTEVLPGVSYTSFKAFVSNLVGVDSSDIALGGSSKFGFSLNPDDRQNKLFRKFNTISDLDLVIVSPKLFEDTWSAMKTAFYNEYYWVMTVHSKHIFRGFIFLDDKRDYKTKYLIDTQKFMRNISSEMVAVLGISRELKYRIYATWEDAYIYHEAGIQQIQRNMLNVAQ